MRWFELYKVKVRRPWDVIYFLTKGFQIFIGGINQSGVGEADGGWGQILSDFFLTFSQLVSPIFCFFLFFRGGVDKPAHRTIRVLWGLFSDSGMLSREEFRGTKLFWPKALPGLCIKRHFGLFPKEINFGRVGRPVGALSRHLLYKRSICICSQVLCLYDPLKGDLAILQLTQLDLVLISA